MKKLKLVLTTAVLASLVGCVNGDDYGTPDLSNDCISIAATKSVQDIATLANTTVQQYPDSDYIEAYVTSSDEGEIFTNRYLLFLLTELKVSRCQLIRIIYIQNLNLVEKLPLTCRIDIFITKIKFHL